MQPLRSTTGKTNRVRATRGELHMVEDLERPARKEEPCEPSAPSYVPREPAKSAQRGRPLATSHELPQKGARP